MSGHDVALIGTGDPGNPGPDGFAMAYVHADAYEKIDGCTIVAAADIVRENAAQFADEYEIPGDAVYEDYEEMLAAEEPDVVSICTPPATHADLVTGCAESGVVDAIHCEKPMALTWAGARRMAAVCQREGVKLTFNHMRRFADPFRDAKRRLDDGVIGDLERVEYSWGNFYDNGTHAIDLCNFLNDEHEAEWVIAQIDYREEDVYFGTHNENQVFACWEYENGVYGVAATGPARGSFADGDFRMVGTDGMIDVTIDGEISVDVKRREEGTTERIEYESLTAEHTPHDHALADAIRALDEGDRSELCAANALTATEIIFAGYESVRRRGRVDLPLDIEDNPLESMVESGSLSPQPADDD